MYDFLVTYVFMSDSFILICVSNKSYPHVKKNIEVSNNTTQKKTNIKQANAITQSTNKIDKEQ